MNDVVGIGHFSGYVADLLMEQFMACPNVRLIDRLLFNTQLDVAELEVEKVFFTYIQTVPIPSMAISLIKPGMTIRKKEQIVVPQNQESRTPINLD